MTPIPVRPDGITILHDTGYRLAPGTAPEDRFNVETPPLAEGRKNAGVRLRADGKTYVWATCSADDDLLIEWALAWSMRIWSYLDEPEFRRLAAMMHIPPAEVEAAIASIQIHDDSYFRRPGRLECTPERVTAWDEEDRTKASSEEPRA
jgi:hypothetical protein